MPPESYRAIPHWPAGWMTSEPVDAKLSCEHPIGPLLGTAAATAGTTVGRVTRNSKATRASKKRHQTATYLKS